MAAMTRPGRCARRSTAGRLAKACLVVLLGTRDLEFHQAAEIVRVLRVEDFGRLHVEFLQILDRQVDAATAGVPPTSRMILVSWKAMPRSCAYFCVLRSV